MVVQEEIKCNKKVKKYKALLVLKGYFEIEGIDFGEFVSLVVKLNSIKLHFSLVVAFDLEVEKMDVKILFLHGDLDEYICMKDLEGFTVKHKKEFVFKIKKSLYYLK